MHILKTYNYCNKNCSICNRLNFKSYITPLIDEIINNLQLLKKKGIKKITLPCNTELRADFFYLLHEIKKLKIKITLLTIAKFFYYLNNCLKAIKYIDYFEYIINKNREFNNTFSRSKSFLESIQGIKNLIKLNAKIKTIIIVNNNNNLEIENYIKINKEIGIKEINIIFDKPLEKNNLLGINKKIIKKYHNSSFKISKSKINNYIIKNNIASKNNIIAKYNITIIARLSFISGAALYTVNMAKYLSDFFKYLLSY